MIAALRRREAACARFRSRALACAGGLLAGALAPWMAVAQEQVEGIVVEDLAYGEVLFHFYQEDYFGALTRLLAAQSRDEMPDHEADAQILLGGLYLSYGQHRLASDIFERLLEQSVAGDVHDRAWFFLAKIWQQRGYLDEAMAALERINEPLPGDLESERRMLHSQVLMGQERFVEALELLESWPKRDGRGRQARLRHDEWVAYAQYNIGVALVRLGEIERGASVLAELGRRELEDGNDDALALRDKANLALGFARLQAGQPALAKPSLQRVRLDGPFSSQALLGVGWSDAEQEDYRSALAPWLELGRRDLLDMAVQESMLAVPFAYAQLGADRQSSDGYVSAIESFSDEMSRLDAAIGAIESGELVAKLLARGRGDRSGWYWRLESVPDSIESRYLYELMATNRFQEALKNYRDLRQLRDNFERWAESLGAFDDILHTKQLAYRTRVPALDSSLAGTDVDELARTSVRLRSQLDRIERSGDFVSLGTAAEQESWRMLESIGRRLELLGDDAGADELRTKHRVLQGMLEWDLRKAYKERLWRRGRELDEVERLIRGVDRSEARLVRERNEWPEEFDEKTRRVAELGTRVRSLLDRADELLRRQELFLQGISGEELRAQRDRLETYTVQARFSLASIYDRAARDLPEATDGVVAEERSR